MTEIELSKIGKLIATIIYIGLLAFLIWPFHMGNPLNWLKTILIIGVCACNAILQGKSALDGEFMSTDNEVSITYFILLVLLQISAIISLVFSTDFLNKSTENNIIGFLYALVVGTFMIIYGIIIAMTILWIITAGFENIDYFIRRRAKYILPNLPIVKLLFKQPKKEKPIEKVKM